MKTQIWRWLIAIIVAFTMTAIGIGCGSGDESKSQSSAASASQSTATSSPTADAVKPPPTASASAAPTATKWSVTHQFIYGQPWPSEKSSEAELQAAVKEAEAAGDQRLVFALNDLAGWYRGKKDFAHAESLYKRVLDLQSKRMGAEHHDVALTHNDLGVLYTESDRPADAEAAFKQTLEIWRKSWDQELRTEDEAASLHNYAALLQNAGRADEAKVMEAKADAIMAARKKALGL